MLLTNEYCGSMYSERTARALIVTATGRGLGAMKRMATIDDVLRQAHRVRDPMTGSVLEDPPGFDTRLLPHLAWPVSPTVQQAIESTVNDAIARNLTLRDATQRVLSVLESFGIVISPDDLRTITGLGALHAI